MDRTVWMLAVMLLAVPAVAGCIADDQGPSYDDGADPPRNESNGTDSDGQDDGQAADGDTRWRYDNRTGTVNGTNATIASVGSEEETFTVDENASTLSLNLSADGGELEACVDEPDGNASMNGTNESAERSCDETFTTQDGQASWSTGEPTAGNWTVELRPASEGPESIDYELVIAQAVPAGSPSQG